MKIALCFRGQPRNFGAGSEYIKSLILEKYDVDIFGHCWWDSDLAGKSYGAAPHAPQNYRIESDLPESLKSIYDFKSIEFETPKTFIPERKYSIIHDHDKTYDSLKSNYYSHHKVLGLLKTYENDHNINYDWTIITRYDIGVYLFPDLNLLDKDMIYVDNFHSGRKFIFNDNLWIFGRNKYAFEDLYEMFDDVYDRMMTFPDEFKDIVRGTELYEKKYISGEQHMALHLLFKGILNNVVKLDSLKYNLIR
jgi:hypothetical protein